MTITTAMIIIKYIVKLTEGFVDVSEDDGKYGVFSVVEVVVTYGIVDVGQDAGTWNTAELVKQSPPVIH